MPPKNPGSAELVAELREHARQHSAVSKMMADAKTARQTDRDDYPELEVRGYSYAAPEDTHEWRAADLIETQAARLEALEGALEPSSETKAAYIGEFHFSIIDWSDDGEIRPARTVSVPWTTIKEIMAAIKARAALGGGRG